MAPPTSMRRESPTPSAQSPLRTAGEKTNSDNESGGEKPVREKLREASIHGQPQGKSARVLAKFESDSDTCTAPSRGRLQKKRSFEDVDTEEEEKEQERTRHVRKRSREAVPGSDVMVADATEVPANGSRAQSATPERMDEETRSGLTSPKNKRTRDQVLLDEKVATTIATADLRPASAKDVPENPDTPSEERKTKRHRDSGSPPSASERATATSTATKIPPSSGFANTSAASPFGALIKPSQPAPKLDPKSVSQTSDDKFKSSGFGSFAKAASPFGSAAPTASPFGATSSAAAPWAAKPATPATQPSAFGAASSIKTSAFGNSSSTSAFGSLTSSKLGGGFGGGVLSGFGATASTSKLSSFAGGSGPTIQGLSSKKVKAFGAANDTTDEEDGESDAEASEGIKSPVNVHAEGEKKDRRFYEQAVETGEEGETNLFSQRCKLYQFVTGEKGEKKWVERGMGTLKLNMSDIADETPVAKGGKEKEGKESKVKLMDAPVEDEDEEDPAKKVKIKARFLMRADGSQRVVLNSALRKDMKFGELDGTEPKDKNIMFTGSMGGNKLAMLQMKMNADRAKALWKMVKELQDSL